MTEFRQRLGTPETRWVCCELLVAAGEAVVAVAGRGGWDGGGGGASDYLSGGQRGICGPNMTEFTQRLGTPETR